MKKNLFLLSASLICFQLYSQTPDIEWQKSYGGSSNDSANSIEQTNDGGYIVAGWSDSTDGDVTQNYGESDCWILKINNSGNIEWQKNIGGLKKDSASAIHQTNDGGYIVAGSSASNDGDFSGNHGVGDFLVVKLSSSGDVQWLKLLGGSEVDQALAIQQTSDNGYVVAGYTYSNDGDVSGNHGIRDFWVVKLDETGELQWQKALGGSQYDQANAVRQTSDGGYIVAGWSTSNDGDVTGHHGLPITRDYWIVKLNGSGEIIWQKSLGSDWDEIAYDVRQTPDDGYIVVGYSESNNTGDVGPGYGGLDYWVVKLNSGGEIQWQKLLGGTEDDTAHSIDFTSDGGYIVSGASKSDFGDDSNHGGFDNWIVKLSNTGEIQWQKLMGGSNDETGGKIKQTSEGGFILESTSESNDGDVSGHHGMLDYWVVKLGPDGLGLNEYNEKSSSSIYPNPVKDLLTIEGISAGSKLIITSINGKIVYRATAKSSKETIDVANLPAGVYFLNEHKFIKK